MWGEILYFFSSLGQPLQILLKLHKVTASLNFFLRVGAIPLEKILYSCQSHGQENAEHFVIC